MLKENGREEFLQLIQENKGIIFRICNSYCRNKNDREDLAQEIIYQLWKSNQTFNNEHRFSTWMYRVALNVAISFYRRERKATNTVLMGAHVIETADENLDAGLESNLSLLQQFINQLKPLDKALLLLYLEEKPQKEIAEIMGISLSNVATKIGRIKELLRQKFSNLKA